MSNSFIPISKPLIGAREKELVLDALDSGWVSSIGKYIDEFEANFARYSGTEYALAVSNGTTGLHLALATLGLGPGDEVIIPDLTFVATANAVAYTGATPVLADIDADTLCLDPRSVKALISPRTKAIIPVHLYGHPADMDALTEIADAHGVTIIEDAAEAHGAEYKGRRAGSLGKCGVFSFYGNKVITTGEGGMLTTNDAAFYQRAAFMQALRARGVDSRPYFCTMSSMPMYRQAPLPVSARKADIGLNLPSYYELTESEVARIGADVNDLLKEMCPA